MKIKSLNSSLFLYRYIYALINKAKRFILSTHKIPATQEPLLSLVQILKCAHEHHHRFPVMTAYLNFEKTYLPQEIETLIRTN